MYINQIRIMLSEEDRNWLKLFFKDNIEFINNNSLIEYENIKVFGDLYEEFLKENNLINNDILMLFLLELRYDQLSHKITENSNKMKMARMAISPIKLSDTIKKWYDESKILEYITDSANETLHRSIQNKVLQRKK